MIARITFFRHLESIFWKLRIDNPMGLLHSCHVYMYCDYNNNINSVYNVVLQDWTKSQLPQR